MKHVCLIAGLLLICGIASIQAKSRVRRRHVSIRHLQGPLFFARNESIEQKLAPFIHTRQNKRFGISPHNQDENTPSETDLFALARQWDHLSPSFKQDYLSALSIPDSMNSYLTPSGHFEIFYTTRGPDAVSPVDTSGFSQADWRKRLSGSNGVPDYVEETGFALDSAWSMIIDRFKFLEPYPYTDTRNRSRRYKVVLRSLSDGYYGMTYPLGKVGDDAGYASFIEIRNEWQGWHLGEKLNYEKNPHLAVWVTAAHEFFHAVQYRMVRKVSEGILLDYFPVSWLEATAVLMEDLAFPSINDYVQYTNSYFSDPRRTLLDDFYDGYDEYKNVLLAKYLYENSPTADSIDFIRRVFFTNLQFDIPFYENLRQTAFELGTSWEQYIGSFHGRSFFTGSRDEGLFLEDASLFQTWDYSPGLAKSDDSDDYSVNNHALFPVSFLREPGQGNRLRIIARNKNQSSNDAPLAISVLLRSHDGNMQDTIIFRTLEDDTIQVTVDNWDSYEEALTVLSNTGLYAAQQLSLTHSTSQAKPSETTDRPPQLVNQASESIESVHVYTVTGRLVAHLEKSGQTLNPAHFSSPALRNRHNLAAGSYLLRITTRNDQNGESSVRMKRITVR
ncbi:MAG: T9SS type A sorting domain-containing protein [Chitinispirillaceae bacterium]